MKLEEAKPALLLLLGTLAFGEAVATTERIQMSI